MTMTTRSGAPAPLSDLPPGTPVRDLSTRRQGVVVDTACQYPHPQARPILQYLIRWEDGQMLAYSEGAFRRGGGLEVVDED